MKRFRPQIASAHFAFVLTGAVTTLLGTILPFLRQYWSLNDLQSGQLFAAQFLASVLTAAVSSLLLVAVGSRRVVTTGLALMAFGVMAAGFAHWPLGLGAVACYGMGLGLTIPATNMWVVESSGENRASALNLLNFSWSAGAVLAPLVLIPTLRRYGIAPVLGSLALLLLFATFWSAVAGKERTAKAQVADERSPHVFSRHERNFALLAGLMLFLYVGTENGFGGWIPSYLFRVHNWSPGFIAWGQSAFWGAILAGRLIAPFALSRMTAVQTVLGSLLLAMVGGCGIIAAESQVVLLAAIVLTGLGLAPIFPTTVAIFTDKLGTSASATAGLIFAAAGLGGAVVPAIVGIVSYHSGNLRFAIVVPVLTTFLMVAVHRAIAKSAARNSAA